MTQTTTTIGRGHRSLLANVASGLVIALALGLFALRFFGTNAIVHGAEWWIGDVALASVFALPAFVGLRATADRPELLLGAGILSLVLSVALLVSVVTLPLVVPGVLYLIAYGRTGRLPGRKAIVIPVLLVAAAGALALLIFAPRTTVCWTETEYADGRVERVRDRPAERPSRDGTFSQSIGGPTPGVVSQGGGCTDGVFPPVRSIGVLGLIGTSTLTARRLA